MHIHDERGQYCFGRVQRTKEEIQAYHARYRKEHQNKLAKKAREYQLSHKKQCARRSKEYGRIHRLEISARNREARQKNPLKFLLRGAKDRAQRFGVLFNLTEADVFMPETCPVLGIKLNIHFGKGNGIRFDDSPSLDKIENSRGYIPGNVRIISWRANRLKQDGNADEHERIARYIRENSK